LSKKKVIFNLTFYYSVIYLTKGIIVILNLEYRNKKKNMLYIPTFISILEVLLVTVPVLLTVAYITVAERKTMASMQRRLGPNIVGYYGLLQAFADALKLILKEYVSPTQANLSLFFLGPIITLIFSLLGYLVIPYGPGLALSDFNLGILYMLAVSSLATYGILLAGWSANSKYAFLGSLRSTAQLISYELILSSAILLVIMLTGSLTLTVIIEAQRAIWFIVPLFPVFIIFFIGSIAETNRAPFDLAEAESELVSGFMTEHAAVIFVFFFLAEYASIVLICILTSLLFLGGYLYDYIPLFSLVEYIDFEYYINNLHNENLLSDPLIEGLLYGLTLGVKSCIMIFIFIWARASFPRIRFDQLMSFCWTILLPIVIAFVILVPCILYGFEIIPSNVFLL
jgi:NADH-ubiquinone oxidoreductase chain 1